MSRIHTPSEAAHAIVDGPEFSVVDDGQVGKGLTVALSAVQRHAPPAATAALLGETPIQRAEIRQWVSLSSQFAVGSVDLSEAEMLVPGTGFLAGGSEPSAADIFLASAVAPRMPADKAAVSTYPRLVAWFARTKANSALAGLTAFSKEVAASSAAAAHVDPTSAGAPAKGGAAAPPPASDKAAKPSAEEIAARRAEKDKAKAAKEAAAPKSVAVPVAAAAPVGPRGSDLDIRVGVILSVAKHPTADRLFVENIDLGEPSGPRMIVSGLVAYYTAEQLTQQSVFVVCNMKPKALQGVESNGMVLCVSPSVAATTPADGATATSAVSPAAAVKAGLLLLQPSSRCPPGTRVSFGSADGLSPAIPPIPSSAKMAELLAGLRTEASGSATWNGEPLYAAGKPITSSMSNALIK